MSYRRRMSRQMSSGGGVLGYLPAECSAYLTDTECQGRGRPDEKCQGIYLLNVVHVFQTQNVKVDVIQTRRVRAFSFCTQCVSPEAELQGKCLLDDARHGICLPDEDRKSIYLRNAARAFLRQNVNANVDRMTRATASAFRTRSVRVFAFSTQRASYRRRMSRQMSSGRGVSGHLPSGHSACITDAE